MVLKEAIDKYYLALHKLTDNNNNNNRNETMIVVGIIIIISIMAQNTSRQQCRLKQ